MTQTENGHPDRAGRTAVTAAAAAAAAGAGPSS